jgi:hypothetical protein
MGERDRGLLKMSTKTRAKAKSAAKKYRKSQSNEKKTTKDKLLIPERYARAFKS